MWNTTMLIGLLAAGASIGSAAGADEGSERAAVEMSSSLSSMAGYSTAKPSAVMPPMEGPTSVCSRLMPR